MKCAMVYGYGVEVASTFEKFYTHVQYSHSLYQVVLECLLVPSCMQRAVYDHPRIIHGPARLIPNICSDFFLHAAR